MVLFAHTRKSKMCATKKLELRIVPCVLLVIIYSATIVQQTTARVELEFGENDYSNAEGIPLRVSISRTSYTDSEIAVTVTAITFQQYRERSSAEQPCNSTALEHTRHGRDFAEATDFASGVFPTTIPAGGGQADRYIEVILRNDTILEKNEIFILILNTNHPDVTLARRCALGVIRENSHTSVSFEFDLTANSDRSLVEHAGMVESLRILKHGQVEFTIDVQITTSRHGDADEGEGLDYTLGIESRTADGAWIVSIRPQDTSIIIPIIINDDPIAEEDEEFEIVGQPTEVIITAIRVTFEIADNDYAQMGFINGSRVVVLEGLSVTLCASLINITIENFQRYRQFVNISTESGTAVESKHFTRQSRKGLSFFKVDQSNPHCITIPTLNDTASEGPREFEVKITDDSIGHGTTPNPLDILHPVLITVVIVEEGKICGEDGLLDAPYEPLITAFNHTGAAKMLHVIWTNSIDVDARHPIDHYRVTFRVAQKTDAMIHTHIFEVHNAVMEYTLDSVDENQLYGVEICAVNPCGASCDEIPLIPNTPAPVITGSPGPPNDIIIIVVVVVFVLLLVLFVGLLILIFCCLWCKRSPKTTLVSPTHHTQHFVQLQKKDPPKEPKPQQQQQQQLLL